MLLCWHFMQTFWDFTAKVFLSWYVFLELRFPQTKTKKERKNFLIGKLRIVYNLEYLSATVKAIFQSFRILFFVLNAYWYSSHQHPPILDVQNIHIFYTLLNVIRGKKAPIQSLQMLSSGWIVWICIYWRETIYDL